MVLRDPPPRVAHEADPAGGQVRAPAHGIVQRAVGLAAHGVDGEVAAGRVGVEIVGELHLRVPPVAGHVPAQGGDLEPPAREMQRDSPVAQPGRHGPEPGGGQQRHRPLGQLGRRDVDVLDICLGIEQSVANATAHEARRPAVRGQGEHDPLRNLRRQPGRLDPLRQHRHGGVT